MKYTANLNHLGICLMVILLQGCKPIKSVPPPPPETGSSIDLTQAGSVDFSLSFDSIIGVTLYNEQASSNRINIDSFTLHLDSENLQINDQVLSAGDRYTMVPKLTVSDTDGDCEGKVPVDIKDIFFKRLRVVVDGKEMKDFYDVKVKYFNSKCWVFNRVWKARDDHEAALQEEVYSLLERIRILEELIKEILVEHPDHAARTLPPELSEARKKINDLEYWYSNNRVPISTIRVSMEELEAMEITLDDLDEELDDPGNFPQAIANAVFFKLGRYKISNNVENESLEAFLSRIQDKVGQLSTNSGEGQKITISLAISGYADDVSIVADLAKELTGRKPTLQEVKDPRKQNEWNVILSEKRVTNVSTYLQNRIMVENPDINIDIVVDGQGFGRTTYPETVTVECPNKCPERRVTLISAIVYRNNI